jgi:hypothetical protein
VLGLPGCCPLVKRRPRKFVCVHRLSVCHLRKIMCMHVLVLARGRPQQVWD